MARSWPSRSGIRQAALLDGHQPLGQDVNLLAAELTQVLVLEDLLEEQLLPEGRVEFVEGLLVAEQAADPLLAVLDVFHERQFVDIGVGAVVAVEVGDDIGKLLQQGEVAPFVDLFVAGLAGLQQDVFEGVVAVLRGLTLGMQQQLHVLGGDAGIDLAPR